MATEKLEIQVSADVQNAVAGMSNLNKALTTFGKVALIGAAGFAGIAAKAIFLDPIIDELKQGFTEIQESIVDSIDPMRKYTVAISEVSGGIVKNAASVFQLVSALESGNLTTEQSRLAQQKLIKEAPAFKDAFDKNGVAVKDLSDVLQNSYIPALINTIKISAASEIITKKLKKSFDTIAAQGEPSKLQGFVNAFKNIGVTFNTAGFAANQAVTKFKNLKEAQDNLTEGNIQAIINQTYKDLGISISDLGNSLDNTGKKVKASTDKIIDLLKNYKEQLRLIEFKETALDISLLNSKIDLASKTFEDFIKQGVNPQSAAFQRVQVDLNNYLDSIKEINKIQDEIQKRSLDPTIINAPRKTNPINIANADRTSALVITPEALRLQGQYSLQLDEVLEKLRLQQELVKSISDTITGGLTAGIDQFFNALANNQDPFEALAQSVKRLVAELGAAVVKALLLKAVTAAFTGGTSEGAGALSGIFGGSVVRSDQLRLLTFLRG